MCSRLHAILHACNGCATRTAARGWKAMPGAAPRRGAAAGRGCAGAAVFPAAVRARRRARRQWPCAPSCVVAQTLHGVPRSCARNHGRRDDADYPRCAGAAGPGARRYLILRAGAIRQGVRRHLFLVERASLRSPRGRRLPHAGGIAGRLPLVLRHAETGTPGFLGMAALTQKRVRDRGWASAQKWVRLEFPPWHGRAAACYAPWSSAAAKPAGWRVSGSGGTRKYETSRLKKCANMIYNGGAEFRPCLS